MREERHGQVKVVVPQLKAKGGEAEASLLHGGPGEAEGVPPASARSRNVSETTLPLRHSLTDTQAVGQGSVWAPQARAQDPAEPLAEANSPSPRAWCSAQNNGTLRGAYLGGGRGRNY